MVRHGAVTTLVPFQLLGTMVVDTFSVHVKREVDMVINRHSTFGATTYRIGLAGILVWNILAGSTGGT